MAAAILLVIASLFAVATGQAGCPTQSKVRPFLLRKAPASAASRSRSIWSVARVPSHTPPVAAPPPRAVRSSFVGDVRICGGRQGVERKADGSRGASLYFCVTAALPNQAASELPLDARGLRSAGDSKATRRAKQGVALIAAMSLCVGGWPTRSCGRLYHERRRGQ